MILRAVPGEPQRKFSQYQGPGEIQERAGARASGVVKIDKAVHQNGREGTGSAWGV